MSRPGPDTRFAVLLRGMRRDAGLSTPKLAEKLGWSQSKVSKTELGRTLPSSADAAAWGRATNADPAACDELVELAERAGYQATEWRRELAPGRVRKQADIRRIEAKASVIRVFSPDVVVGLAQTRPYASAMFRLGRKTGVPAESLDDVIAMRMARQRLLSNAKKRFIFVMGETAFHRRLVSRAEMREQVRRLIDLSQEPNVTMGVIPFAADENVHQYHGFAILGELERDAEAIVLAETLTRELAVRSPTEMTEYIAHFSALQAEALEGDTLRSWLARFARDSR